MCCIESRRLLGGNIDTESFGPSFCMDENLELPSIEMDSNEEDESDDDL